MFSKIDLQNLQTTLFLFLLCGNVVNWRYIHYRWTNMTFQIFLRMYLKR